MVSPVLNPIFTFFTTQGVPAAGGTVTSYIPGTTTLKNTYADYQGLTLNTNPIILDANGDCTIFGNGQYRLVGSDSLGNVLFDTVSETAASSIDLLSLGISAAMLPVVEASTIPIALGLLGVNPIMQPFVASTSIDAAVGLLGNIGTVTSINPVLQFNITESLALGTGFYDAIVVNLVRTGGTGNRQAFTSQITCQAANVGDNLVGGAMFGFLTGGSGSIFGGNSYAQVLSPATITSECVSFEANTDARVNVTRKCGIQIVDEPLSGGDGTRISAGLYIVRDGGASQGYQTGIQFGDDFTPYTDGARTTLIRTGNATTGGTLQRGIDLRTMTPSAASIDLPSGLGGPGQIAFSSGLGGSIWSNTNVAGPIIQFGNAAWAIVDNGAVTQVISATFGTVPTVNINIAASTGGSALGIKSITAGPANSGGTGFRMLVIPN